MRKIKKTSIAEYISIRFMGITFVMGILMAVFVTYFSNEAINFDIRSQIRKESKYDYLNINLENGQIVVSDDFVYEDNRIYKVILDREGKVISGEYPEEGLKKIPLSKNFQNQKVREVKCGENQYYMYDQRIIKSNETMDEKKMIAVVRSVVNKQDISSDYQVLKNTSYFCAVIIMLIVVILSFIISRQIVEPIKQICYTAEKIGQEKDLSQRIKYDGGFKEITILADANNRMLDRLEEMFEKQTQFTSDVAHELKTPVAVVMAECQYARKHIENKEEFDEEMSLIERQIKKTNQIITQLLQLSRLDQERIEINFEYVDLRDIVEQVCENEKVKDQKQIDIRLHLEKAEAWVDVGLIMIVIRNLVSNAMKYSKPDDSIDIHLKREEDTIKFVVQDYGCGMTEEERKQIFDRFYRADKARNSEGFGLGLSISSKIVELHHGQIKVASVENRGSIFTLLLPENPKGE